MPPTRGGTATALMIPKPTFGRKKQLTIQHFFTRDDHKEETASKGTGAKLPQEEKAQPPLLQRKSKLKNCLGPRSCTKEETRQRRAKSEVQT